MEEGKEEGQREKEGGEKDLPPSFLSAGQWVCAWMTISCHCPCDNCLFLSGCGKKLQALASIPGLQF